MVHVYVLRHTQIEPSSCSVAAKMISLLNPCGSIRQELMRREKETLNAKLKLRAKELKLMKAGIRVGVFFSLMHLIVNSIIR